MIVFGKNKTYLHPKGGLACDGSVLPCLRLPGKALLHWSRHFGGPSTPPRWCKPDTDALPRHADLLMVPLTQRRDLQPPTLPFPSGAGEGLSCRSFCVGATQGPEIPKQG